MSSTCNRNLQRNSSYVIAKSWDIPKILLYCNLNLVGNSLELKYISKIITYEAVVKVSDLAVFILSVSRKYVQENIE